jgi:glutamine amidotransferase
VTIAVLDYRAGNLTSVVKALTAAGAETRTISRAADLARAQAIVIPGVGHFGAITAIDETDRLAIRASIAAGVPLLGICLGLQWLFEGSDEAPDRPGLGLLPGRCVRLIGAGKIPHVGWNTLEATGRPSRLMAAIPAGAFAYFTHSYAASPDQVTAATTTHGVRFASIVERGLVFGTQFHPEKSGTTGLRILAAFVEIAREAGVRC